MDKMTTVYKIPWLIDFVHQECENSRVTYTDKLEDRVIKKLGDYLIRYPDQKKNRQVLFRWTKKYIKYLAEGRYRMERSEYFSEMPKVNVEGDEQEFEPVDVLANVESEVIKETTINLLAQEDRRKRMILSEWENGNAIDTDISNVLANVLGGKASGHRIYIQRFRIDCKKKLESVAI